MIAFLTGTPQLVDQQLILVVAGVGYGVAVSQKVLQAATKTTQLSLYIHTHLRADLLKLYGFLSYREQQLFELLLGVSGVGPTIALQLMDKDPQDLIKAVQEAELGFFKSVPRVGKKLAQKIIIDLRGKLGELKELNLAPLSGRQRTVAEALESLGFADQAIATVLNELELDQLSDEAALKLALQTLGKR